MERGIENGYNFKSGQRQRARTGLVEREDQQLVLRSRDMGERRLGEVLYEAQDRLLLGLAERLQGRLECYLSRRRIGVIDLGSHVIGIYILN